ncbi:MAG: NUDIX hydrolase [Clostridiales bacterium]|nr:NUDIX hydrolase [Clostridiales bacterium]
MNDALSETILHEDTVYRGRLLHVTCAEVSLPNGRTSKRDLVRHPGGVVVVAVTDDGRVYLERQFRTALGCVITELPAGKREPGEDPDLTARRELKEETGLVAQRWEKLGELVTTPGFSDETLHIYLATGLAQQETERDEDEFIELFTLPLEEAYQQAMRGALPDAKTIAGLAMAHARWTAEHTKGE